MKKFLIKIFCVSLISFYFIDVKQVHSIIPYYYFPTTKNLEKESLSIAKNAYQLLYFGQYKESLNLAKLAVKINKRNEKLWLILAETQIANELYKNALDSLNNSQLQNAKTALEAGLRIEPNNHNAIFQLGNIFLKEKNYLEAIKLFDKSIEIKPDFWQAINNKGLAYYEKNNINL